VTGVTDVTDVTAPTGSGRAGVPHAAEVAPRTPRVAPDGSPVDAFALLPPGPGPALIAEQVLAPLGRPATVLELGCGAARLLKPLAALGHHCTGVDQSPEMLALVPPLVETHLADIEHVDLGRRFDAVLLASFLVNTVDAGKRHAYLRAAHRHVAPGGAVVVQRLDPELVPEAVDATSEEEGVVYEMRDVQHAGTLFRATMRFVIGGVAYDHPYEGEVLDDDACSMHVRACGMHVRGYLDGQRTWMVLGPADAPPAVAR
jgi:SAM-dependent methyltransferase